ncbi:S1 RNA-binding domain-containing protein [Blastopirellula sp. JC732]|uniref:S1 RNA-binding domain-containing protein n=1 Tax=Blastopirellula sediminis TaxID=2894196 RepID=A0A9X1SIY9_9BACT|nr:S1 RNA-binding domain-containing protein [Blastopirellula sediminis]MCC9605384.1 S1 RNA-binding domain-containing protein [Blastopirellula sediminis]MCC9631316.1 S1 RNA-binding domain-containing protein [Blastopirellula sediminis]
MSVDPSQDPQAQGEIPAEASTPAPENVSQPSEDADAPKRKLLIGSQRDEDKPAPAPKPAAAARPQRPERPKPSKTESEEDPTAIPADLTSLETNREIEKLPVSSDGRVEVPNRRQKLDDIEREVEAALGGLSLDDMIAGEKAMQGISGKTLEVDSRQPATVLRIHREEVFIDLPGQNQGFVSLRTFVAPPAVGDKLEVVIVKYDREQGLYEAVVPGSSVSVVDWGDLKEGILVDAVVDGVNKGGLECAVGGARGFIPASQIAPHHVTKMEDYLGQKLQCLVTEANPERRNLVLSARAVAEKAKEDSRKETMGTLQVGQMREGTVTRIQDFGAFVDIGGVDGLVHVSQISWDRIKHPSDALSEGQAVRVKVTKIDPETGKIGLSIRDTMENPWQKVASEFAVGAIVKGKVTKIMEFGAFVEIGPGIEGLIHVSEVSHTRVSRIQSVLKVGETVEVKVVNIDQEKRRIGLSIKALAPAPASKSGGKKKEEEEVDVDRELKVKPTAGELKGGIVNEQSEGSKFGLKW